ncbi:hypothetical protein EMCRGX_G031254 [Ephydatia muelleri]
MAEDGNGFNRENVRLRTKHQPAKKGSEQVKRQIIFGHVEVKKGSKRDARALALRMYYIEVSNGMSPTDA